MPPNTSTRSSGHPPSQPAPLLETILGQPLITLKIYAYMATITRQKDGHKLEYAVDPTEFARLLNSDIALETDFIPPGVVWIRQRLNQRHIASYRPPQRTGIWLEGAPHALRIPLPGLLLIHNPATRNSQLFAVKTAPTGKDAPLFAAPLPNTDSRTGSVCWGSVQVPKLDAPNDLTPVWRHLLGSAFVSHSVDRKSAAHPDDIRTLLVELHDRHAAEYPLGDLMPAAKPTLESAIESS